VKFIYLTWTFFKIGLFSVGGGLATLPFLFEIADNYAGINADKWLTRETIGNMLAVAQSLPGPVGSNLSTYTGFSYLGVPGGFVSAAALAAPSIIIILIIARMLSSFKENKIVQNLFAGFRPAAAGLLSAAGFGAITLSLWNSAAAVWYEHLRWKETLIFIVIFFLVYKFKKHPIVYIAAAGALGVILKLS